MKWNPGQEAAYQRELDAAAVSESCREFDSGFAHLERAHVLGQRSTIAHVYAHWRMLRFGWHRRDLREVCGQLPRLLAALTKSMIWVPPGNTGGARVNPFRSMPVADDLRIYLD